MDKKGDIGRNKIITWILLIAFLLFMFVFIFGLDKIIKNTVDAIFFAFG